MGTNGCPQGHRPPGPRPSRQAMSAAPGCSGTRQIRAVAVKAQVTVALATGPRRPGCGEPGDRQVPGPVSHPAQARSRASTRTRRCGPLDPFPHDRCSNTASLATSSARMTAPEGRVTRKSRGTTATCARFPDSQNRRSSLLRPYTSSYAAHRAGRPAASRRPIWPMASCGLVLRSTLSGMPAARPGAAASPSPSAVA